MMLTTQSPPAHPLVVPAPWRLTGGGYILLFRFPAALAAEEAAGCAGGLGAVMIVRYTSSGVGPYDELLCIPGRLGGWGWPAPFTISTIYVSSEASVVSGQANWGIPKRRADFVIARDGDADLVRVADESGPIASFRLRAAGPSLPFSTGLIPPPLRRIAQAHAGRRLLTTPGGRGRIRPARLLSAEITPGRFPDLGRARLLGAVGVDGFELTFPPARAEKRQTPS